MRMRFSLAGMVAALVLPALFASTPAWGQNPYGPQYRVAQNPQGAAAGPPAAAPPGTPGNGIPLGPRPVAGPAMPGVPRSPAAPLAPPPILAPEWADKLPPAEVKHIDDILKFWEFKSEKINNFECQFERWEYSPQWGPKDPSIAFTYASGAIKFEKPDKGLFKVEQLGYYTAPKGPGLQPTYEARPGEVGEHWVCDGKSIFEFLPSQQVLRETKLPPEMQGKAIANGPLPFMFGMEAAKLKQRYWLKVVTPREAKNQYWLWAVPKSRGDASNYKHVEVILSATDFLPDAMQMVLPNNGGRVVFQFANRKVNPVLPDLLPFWKANDFKPALPAGWRKEVNDPSQPARSAPLSARPGINR